MKKFLILSFMALSGMVQLLAKPPKPGMERLTLVAYVPQDFKGSEIKKYVLKKIQQADTSVVVKPMPTDKMHVTIFPMGDIPEAQVSAVTKAMKKVVKNHLHDLVFVDKKNSIKKMGKNAVVMPVTMSSTGYKLFNDILNAVTPIVGIPLAGRQAWLPHVTVTRIGSATPAMVQVVDNLKPFGAQGTLGGSCVLTDFRIISTSIGAHGQEVKKEIKRFTLKPGAQKHVSHKIATPKPALQKQLVGRVIQVQAKKQAQKAAFPKVLAAMKFAKPVHKPAGKKVVVKKGPAKKMVKVVVVKKAPVKKVAKPVVKKAAGKKFAGKKIAKKPVKNVQKKKAPAGKKIAKRKKN